MSSMVSCITRPVYIWRMQVIIWLQVLHTLTYRLDTVVLNMTLTVDLYSSWYPSNGKKRCQCFLQVSCTWETKLFSMLKCRSQSYWNPTIIITDKYNQLLTHDIIWDSCHWLLSWTVLPTTGQLTSVLNIYSSPLAKYQDTYNRYFSTCRTYGTLANNNNKKTMHRPGAPCTRHNEITQ